MIFTKHMRFDEPYYFCGVYKIVKYSFHRGSGKVKAYYQAYKHNGTAWGDYVNRSLQHDSRPTLLECKNMCIKHQVDTGTACASQLKAAMKTQTTWLVVK